MAYALPPARSTQRRIRRVAIDRIDDALGRLDAIAGDSSAVDPAALEDAVHEIRKRCKEVRGLAQLVRPALGPTFRRFDRLVRDAAGELSSVRDAQVLLVTLDRLKAASPDDDHATIEEVRARLIGREPTPTFGAGDLRVRRAAELLRMARTEAASWAVPKGFAPLRSGLGSTYRRGARWHARALKRPSDERFHEWRKAVKQLWYQLRLLEPASPGVLGPLVADLDRLADALGDDHDLTVLVERLGAEPDAFGGPPVVERVRDIARARQHDLRRAALRSGATVYAETRSAFVERIERYWTLTIHDGVETVVGGLEALAASRRPDGNDRASPTDSATIERERKWLVAGVPAGLELRDGVALRQGYLAIDGTVSARVRDAGDAGCTLTLKIGRGVVRTELEWPVERDVFDQAWPSTDGRRVTKTRFRHSLDGRTAEIDVFGGALDGLVMVEVEFDDDESMADFVPPAWFGREVSNDERYTNASLAVAGLEPSAFV
jgi:CYTH domain-containing protein/CHAD domain-containing protein